MKPVLTCDEMRAADAEALSGLGEDGHEVLVGRAGAGVAKWALDTMGGSYGRRVVVVAGKGNNGADGRVAARLLQARGARVEVVDASEAPDRIGPPGVVDLVIDAAYGTGFRGEYHAPSVPAGVAVLAVDIPSGVDGDSGVASGSPLRADVTVTMAALKTGLVQGDGPMLAGRVEVVDIGVDPSRARIFVVEDSDVDTMLPERTREAHKWQAAVGVVAGSPGMVGAATMCARAAYRAGAGMVRLGVTGAEPRDLPVGEAVARALPVEGWSGAALEMAERCKAIVVGPGIGRSKASVNAVRSLVTSSPVPVVVDADGLFALGTVDEAAEVMRSAKSAGNVLTPHEGEIARLVGEPPGADRIGAARAAAEATGAIVLLKGATTVVADPKGGVLLATAGSPRLATAGTGDVLAGVIGAFIARGVSPHPAAGLGAHVHGRAGALGSREGLMASDLADLVAKWLSERHKS
jgi:NAD(P)H-hydrate epimerase